MFFYTIFFFLRLRHILAEVKRIINRSVENKILLRDLFSFSGDLVLIIRNLLV